LLKIMTVAALAAFAIAAPASASEIRIPIAGKTAMQLDAEIQTAAQTVCKADTAGRREYEGCLQESLRGARAQLRQFATNDGQKLAQR
jgi:hypothetical protein